MASSPTKLTLKLLVDTKSERVLFAEAPKAVVDFLFNLLCLPVGTIVRLLKKNGMLGSLANVYESAEKLNDTYYLQPNQDKDILLNPRPPFSAPQISAALLPPASEDNISILYMCRHRCNYYVAYGNNIRCKQCGNIMDAEVQYASGDEEAANGASSSKNGFVKEVVTYMVMDNLVVQPMSTISSITLLNKFNIKEVGALQEKVVELGMAEGIKILKASLQSEMVLTSVFLKNMGS